ncbi:hypothetical protein EYB53_019240 [Candidatus Chloroploca sp. M-50]|uniref:Uncharacterized protein n=1 Tax=Candidatus Chloroploca mongolica TaxID=2528176 RepID=A0ABS4DEI4_9CHLR|nr:hypothetical protein [Candidatus Chloroploca mongolica]
MLPIDAGRVAWSVLIVSVGVYADATMPPTHIARRRKETQPPRRPINGG